jgi:uncharacterized repeat protein (TIGR03803 family)
MNRLSIKGRSSQMKRMTGQSAGRAFVAILAITLALVNRVLAQTETILNNFNSSNGSYSLTPVIFDNSGNLYGTAIDGGSFNLGAVFKLTKSGGRWTETVLWNFDNNGTDGWNSHGVVLDSAGNLYGTTQQGGRSNYGIVYEITPRRRVHRKCVPPIFRVGVPIFYEKNRRTGADGA